MNDKEQIEAFAEDLARLIRRYCEEFDLSTAGAIGVLEMTKHELIAFALKEEEE